MLAIGSGSHDIAFGVANAITACFEGVGMMGYVKPGNVCKGIETPLTARAFVLKDPESGRKLAYAVAEICFITLAIQRGVLDRLARLHPELGYDDASVMLTATHTHSAPGGYSHHFFYNTSIPGFVPAVYEAIVVGITEAIAQADRSAVPGTARLAAGAFPPEVPVAFNRSLTAHNANRDVTPRPESERHLAVDREMTLLRFEDAGGRPCACLNWFAVHATSVPNTNTLITPDNKGYAARLFEEAMGPGPFVAGFAQGPAGDVSPNFRRSRRGFIGTHNDPFESARHHGRLQYEQARALLTAAAGAAPLAPRLDAVHCWVNMADVEIPPDLADGESGHRTSHAAIGARMLRGTSDGWGLSKLAGAAVHHLSRASCARERLACRFLGASEREAVLAKLKSHGNKAIFMEMGAGKILGTRRLLLSLLPGWAEPSIGHVKAMARRGLTAHGPWSPQVLPIQLMVVGELAIAAVPAEFTTQAGRRLRALLEPLLAPLGVARVVVAAYANAYSGYVTTPEEYDVQAYEGASTHFGRWTLPAYLAKFRELALELAKPPDERLGDRGPRPAVPRGEALVMFCHEVAGA